jgi:hypothetical protein
MLRKQVRNRHDIDHFALPTVRQVSRRTKGTSLDVHPFLRHSAKKDERP